MLFSVYIYIASSTSRTNIFLERIKQKALDTREIYELHDRVAEKVIISLPEQSEYVFDEHGKEIFGINDVGDYAFDESFFKSLPVGKEIYFSFQGNQPQNYKEGYAFSFDQDGKKRTIAITAYNKSGFDQMESLAQNLVAGNLFFLIAAAIAAFTFSSLLFRPINDLVHEVETIEAHDLKFRLSYQNPKNEIGIVAGAFNRVLDRVQSLMDSQKSFISYASHELRTPLAAIAGILETSINYDKDKDAMSESLKAAQHEIQRATILVNGLLQLAKIESATEREEMVRLNIIDLLLDVISFYKLKNPLQEFAFDMPEPSQGNYIEVNGFPQFLRTAFVNLIDNASKYSFHKKINIKLTNQDNKIKISVIDKGIGIDDDGEHQLFDVFYRGKNVAGIDGFGLGLPFTQKIIALHGGEIRLIPNESSGMTAEVILPAIIEKAS